MILFYVSMYLCCYVFKKLRVVIPFTITIKQKRSTITCGAFLVCGEGGIRTRGTV